MTIRTSDAAAADALAALSSARTRVVVQPTAMRVADALREQISDGLFPPGSRLPEEAIGQALGVSRNTVREAFIELAGQQLLVRAPNRGVFVTVLDEPAIRDIYRARRIIEIGVLHHVVDTGSVSAARTAVNEGLAARARGDVPAVTTANQHFHRAIVALAGSPSLDRLMTQMLAQIRLALHGAQSHRSFHEQFVDENNQLCLLLEQGRFGEAARAMESYLERSEQGVLEATRVR